MTILKFLEWDNNWKSHLPDCISIYNNGKKYLFKLGNIMQPSDTEYQITYDDPSYGFPDTLEIDIYKINNKNKIDIDITCGDFVVFSFSIKNGNVSVKILVNFGELKNII